MILDAVGFLFVSVTVGPKGSAERDYVERETESSPLV